MVCPPRPHRRTTLAPCEQQPPGLPSTFILNSFRMRTSYPYQHSFGYDVSTEDRDRVSEDLHEFACAFSTGTYRGACAIFYSSRTHFCCREVVTGALYKRWCRIILPYALAILPSALFPHVTNARAGDLSIDSCLSLLQLESIFVVAPRERDTEAARSFHRGQITDTNAVPFRLYPEDKAAEPKTSQTTLCCIFSYIVCACFLFIILTHTPLVPSC